MVSRKFLFLCVMSVLQKWITKIRTMLFTYEGGFFVFPVLASDPESIIKGFKKTPFVKYFDEKKLAQTKTPFLDGDAYFNQVESDLWIICSLIKFKKNICFKVLLDPSTPSNFYTLTINSNISSSNVIKSKSGQKVERLSYYWELFKPQAITRDYHYANTTARIITFYIHENWIEEHFKSPGLLNEKIENWFDNPNAEVLLLSHRVVSKFVSVEELFHALETQQMGSTNHLRFKANVMTFLSAFSNELNSENTSALTVFSPAKEAAMMRVERILKDAIFSGFPSISSLAKEMGMSETKLKTDFKEVFAVTTYQYFSSCQMDVAEEMLKSGNDSIKNIAFSLGYSHPGKFSSAFRKIKNISPSEVREQSTDS